MSIVLKKIQPREDEPLRNILKTVNREYSQLSNVTKYCQ